MFNPAKALRQLNKMQSEIKRMADELHEYVSNPPPWGWPEPQTETFLGMDIQKAWQAHDAMLEMKAPEAFRVNPHD